MQCGARKGFKSIRYVWRYEHVQEPPEDCLEYEEDLDSDLDDLTANTVYRPPYIRSARQVLNTCAKDHPGIISDAVIEALDQRHDELVAAMDGEHSTLDPPDDLSNYSEILKDGEISELTAVEFASLASRDAMGKAEATRLLRHLTKPGVDFITGPSQRLHHGIEQSLEYLSEWQRWESQNPHYGGPMGERTRHRSST